MDPAAEAKLLRLLGLGVRGRGAVVGVDRVREAAQKGTLALAVVAPDASRHSLDKVLPLLAAKRVTVIEGPGATALGHAVGRETTAADWTHRIDVGDVTTATIDLAKDNVQFGLRAVDRQGLRSPVAFPRLAS